MNADPETRQAYLAKNAQRMREWRARNKETHSEWRKMNTATRRCGITGQARAKGIPLRIPDTHIDMLIRLPCYYCDYQDPLVLNGIDRIDNNEAYTPSNVVSCCKYCNFIKKATDPATFRDRCRHIAGLESAPSAWPNSLPCTTYAIYQSRAQSKNIPFHLARDEFERLRNAPCHYCRRAGRAGGVDRRDNTEYSAETCVPCCTQCNSMKADLPEAEFLACCERIAHKFTSTKLARLPPVPRMLLASGKRRLRREPDPVADVAPAPDDFSRYAQAADLACLGPAVAKTPPGYVPTAELEAIVVAAGDRGSLPALSMA